MVRVVLDRRVPYGLYTVVFFLLTRTQPPGKPWLNPDHAVDWFDERQWGLRMGFALIFVLGGFSATSIALITYSIKRMSVSRAFAHSYLDPLRRRRHPRVPVHVHRHDRRGPATRARPSPAAVALRLRLPLVLGHDGRVLIGSLVWMAAILLDKNAVFPRWFGYLNLCNALTEVVIAPSWIFQRGVLAWNGVIGWWIDVVVFGAYTCVFIYLLRNLIQRDDLGTGPVPALAQDQPRRPHPLNRVIG